MMDRNLGALSQTERHGPGTLYYQLGRKDPFMYASSMNGAPTKGVTVYNRYNDALEFPFKTKAQLESANSQNDLVRYSIYHPDTYLLVPGDWTWGDVGDYSSLKYCCAANWCDPKLTSGKTPNLNAKSIFDPCPAGWRVAPKSSMTNPAGTVTQIVNNISVRTLPNGAVIYLPYSGDWANGGPSNTYVYQNGIPLWSNQIAQGTVYSPQSIDGGGNANRPGPVRCVSYIEP